MMKLVPYELGKIWKKKSFQVFTAVLVILNVFLLWYTNRPKEEEPPLSAYKKIVSEVHGMTENEKLAYILGLKERIDAICIIDDTMNLLSNGNDYLIYTASLSQEKRLIDEAYEEIKTVCGYEDYLMSVQKNKASLNEISIFSSSDSNSFSRRNVEKSAQDHSKLSDENISWYPSKGFLIADGSIVTELFLLLSVFLFVGGLITEEKQKGLFYITRCTKKGVAESITAKLGALLIHCLVITILLSVINFMFAQATAGLGDLTAILQSIPKFMESSLHVSLLEYIILGILTKSLVLFCFGTALTAIAIVSSRNFMPHLVGVGILVLNWLAYTFIPAYSYFASIKYMSVFGLMKPSLIYGGYLNFNIVDYPVSRLAMALWVIFILSTVGALLCILLFCHTGGYEIRKNHFNFLEMFKPHGTLGLHEGYKLLVMGKAAVILILFAALIGNMNLGKRYASSVSEQYYRDIMLKLEGELTKEKETLILAEQARYDEAFEQLERIDSMIASGELDQFTGGNMKTKWYGVVSFYPSFERVLSQYGNIKAKGGIFIYDTGYACLFGRLDDSMLTEFLLLSLCMVFAFGTVMSMEYEKKSWNLLSATTRGKQAIIKKKILVIIICSTILTVMTWVFRIIAVSREYPLNSLGEAVNNIPLYFGVKADIPIWMFMLFTVACHILSVLAVSAVVFFISWWRKTYLQTIFLSLLLLIVPIALTIMGFDFARWVSFFPLYELVKFI